MHQFRINGVTYNIPSFIVTIVFALLAIKDVSCRSTQKVAAIKFVREQFPVFGLAEAKWLCDFIWDEFIVNDDGNVVHRPPLLPVQRVTYEGQAHGF
jgi:hypothetical protein